MTFPDLNPALSGIPWAVVGAAASRNYMPERSTCDLDILIRASDAPNVAARLSASGYSQTGALTIGGSSWRGPDGFPIDVIECAEDWCDQALDEARENRDPQGLPILPLPYLVLMKLKASRVQDLADSSRMLGAASVADLQAVRAIFARWLPDEMDDLESLITLGRLELGEE